MLFAAALTVLAYVSISRTTTSAATPSAPAYTKDGDFMLPSDYRSWTFLTSNVAMSYPMAGMNMDNMPQTFGNVFANPDAVKGYEKTGLWPDKTVLLIENRGSGTKPTLTKNAKFQTSVLGFEAHVKDASHGGWAFYFFRPNETSAKALPKDAACFTCHARDAAVDTTFVQYYPTLIDVAKKMGTYKNVD
jgi:hypothetical protein